MADLKKFCIDGNCFTNTEPTYTKTEVDDLLDDKQDTLTAGENVIIANNVISAKDTTYTAGEGVVIEDGVISVDVDTDIFIPVSELPQIGEENKIYLLPKQGGGFEEWIYHDGAWEEVGDTEIDLSNYYTKTETDDLLDDKADKASTYTKTEVDTLLDDKADSADVYTKTETDSLLDGKADVSTVYTKTETDNLLDEKADANTVYTKTETDSLLDEKADATSVYTKTETDTLLGDKADKTDVYTKTETDALLDDKADASTVYTKTETDTLLADKLECSDLSSCQTIIDMNTAISGKQDALTAGSNIQLNGSTISATDTTYSDATQSDSGLMSAADKTKLDEIELIWGKDETNGGIYYPRTLEPERVANNSVLVSEATKMTVGSNRIFALVGGININLKVTAQAGATRFEVSNTFANRFSCAMARGGYATIEQSTAGETIVNVTAVYCANDPDTPLVPYSGASESRNNIIIETDAPLSDTDTITKLRLYGTMTYDTSFHCGMGVGTGGLTGKGKLLQLGQSQLALDGNSLIVGNSMFTSKNRVILVGASHINHIQSACMTGEGHDSVNGTKIGLTAHGVYSDITENTMFVIGNGTSNVARNNLFEIADNNGATEVIMKSPNNTAWKLTVDDNGNLTTTAV